MEHHHRPDRVGGPGFLHRPAGRRAPAAGRKLIEEAAELTAAALDHQAGRADARAWSSRKRPMSSTQLLVLLAERGATPGEVIEELARRRR